MNLYKQVKAFFLRNKVSSFEYDCVKAEIYKTNRNLLSVCAFVASVLFFVLAALSKIFDESAAFGSHYVYVATFLLMLAILLVCHLLPEKQNRWAALLFYCFYVSLCLFAIYSGVFIRPDDTAVIYFVIEFGFPLIFLDKTKRFFLISLAMTIIFCVFSAILKSAKVCELDILYAVVFYFISFLPSFYLTKIRVREFSLRQLIETERDTDELTGLLNKAAFVREAKKNLAATKNGILIILDLDSFKKINDTYGHFTGDNVLKIVGTCIRNVFRNSDVMGRFGGDEFVVFMANTNLTDIAMLRCRQLLQLLNSTKIFPNDDSNKTTIRASVGFSRFEQGDDFDSLFKKADGALYRAKNGGKNVVCMS